MNGYNGSIIRHDGKLLMTYRSHRTGNASTQLAIAELDDKLNVLNNQWIESSLSYSLEDGRLFTRGRELWLSFVESTWPNVPTTCVVKYGRLDLRNGKWSIASVFQPKYPGNDHTTMQKNYVFFESDSKLFCIYGIFKGEQIVLEIEGENVVRELKSPAPTWGYGEIRGGAIVICGAGLLRFFHSRRDNEFSTPRWRYYSGVLLMEPFPPFKAFKVCETPLIAGSETCHLSSSERADCQHYKANVVMPMGVVKQGDEYLLSCGVNDSSCVVVKIKKEDLKL